MALAALVPIPANAGRGSREELRVQARLLTALEEHLSGLPADRVSPFRRGQLQAMLAEMKRLTGERSLLRGDLQGIEGEIRRYSHQSDAYRDEYRQWVRLAAKGEEYAELVTVSGRRFEKVVIRRVTGVGLEIRHANGATRLRHDVLPPEFQERFRWDSSTARDVLEKEAEVAFQVARLRRIAAQTRALRARSDAAHEEGKPLESRLDSSGKIEPGSIDSLAPVQPRAIDSPARIIPHGLDSSTGIAPLKIRSFAGVRPRPLGPRAGIQPREIQSSAELSPGRLSRFGGIRSRPGRSR